MAHIVPQDRPKPTLENIKLAGCMAYKLGKSAMLCPYRGGTPEAVAWCTGFAEARKNYELRFDKPIGGQLLLRVAMKAGYRNRKRRISL